MVRLYRHSIPDLHLRYAAAAQERQFLKFTAHVCNLYRVRHDALVDGSKKLA